MDTYLVVVFERGVAVAHAIPDNGVVLPTESHRAAQSPPVLRDYMAGSLKHLQRHEKGADISLTSFRIRSRLGLYSKLWVTASVIFSISD